MPIMRACCAMLHTVQPAGVLEALGGEAGAAVGQHLRDPEGQGGERLLQEGHRRGGGLVVRDGQMHETRAAIDGHVQVALTGDAIPILRLAHRRAKTYCQEQMAEQIILRHAAAMIVPLPYHAAEVYKNIISGYA